MVKAIYSKEHRSLVERLKADRKEKGLDQEAVAKLLGVTQSYISKIESGQRRIDIVQFNGGPNFLVDIFYKAGIPSGIQNNGTAETRTGTETEALFRETVRIGGKITMFVHRIDGKILSNRPFVPRMSRI